MEDDSTDFSNIETSGNQIIVVLKYFFTACIEVGVEFQPGYET